MPGPKAALLKVLLRSSEIIAFIYFVHVYALLSLREHVASVGETPEVNY